MASDAEALDAPFSETTKTAIRERYGKICSVCHREVITGHCAHLDGQTQIFGALSYPGEYPPDLQHLFQHYSLIPIFRAKFKDEIERLDLFRALPPVSILFEGEFRQDIRPARGDTTFRIFDHMEARPKLLQKGNLPTFGAFQFRARYLFMVEANKLEEITEFTSLEIVVGRNIYAGLDKARKNRERRSAKFPKKSDITLASPLSSVPQGAQTVAPDSSVEGREKGTAVSGRAIALGEPAFTTRQLPLADGEGQLRPMAWIESSATQDTRLWTSREGF
ncbi:hypothetical protein DFH07DRAFT_967176 [Mycena maculata]|uniref:Uncharacterized protein n=1 Tax=Mycena maculata TaxID=230809 RepID=A0AAD7I5J6_9AGAR|nr:hypothetical protein DFH07DRAFT_967176 [Mycena maculata]